MCEWQLALLDPCCTLCPAPTAVQSVLSIILGGDKQWLVRVSTVAGVVVLRTLLQVRRAGQCTGRSFSYLLVVKACHQLPATQARLHSCELLASFDSFGCCAAGPHRQPERQERGPGTAPGPAGLCAVRRAATRLCAAPHACLKALPCACLKRMDSLWTSCNRCCPLRRLIGVSVLQSCASAVLAPSLRHVADMLALNWRARLTRSALAKYLAGEAARAVRAAPKPLQAVLWCSLLRACSLFKCCLPSFPCRQHVLYQLPAGGHAGH